MEKSNREASKFVFPFEKLEVWQLAVDLADTVLALLEGLPQKRHLCLHKSGGGRCGFACPEHC